MNVLSFGDCWRGTSRSQRISRATKDRSGIVRSSKGKRRKKEEENAKGNEKGKATIEKRNELRRFG
jgi:hypothetical protein